MAQLHDIYNDRTLHSSKCTTHLGTVSCDQTIKDPVSNVLDCESTKKRTEVALITANIRGSNVRKAILNTVLTHPLPQIVGEHQVT